jgi:hypothetical protein
VPAQRAQCGAVHFLRAVCAVSIPQICILIV